MTQNAIQFIQELIKEGKNVGIFSCEDPYNTPFHKDLLHLSHYVHLIPKAGAVVILESIDLGLQAKGINAWGIFGHCGNVHGHEVCAAIKALREDYSDYGPDLSRHIDFLGSQFNYDIKKTLKENIIAWAECQYNVLLKIIPEKQKTLKGAVQGPIVIFAGLVENSHDGKSYMAEVLFSNQN